MIYKNMEIRFFTLGLVLTGLVSLLFSCGEKNTISISDLDRELGDKIKVIAGTPDSLRSAEDRELYRILEVLLYEKSSFEEGIELTISKREFLEMGLSELWYGKIKRELAITNQGLNNMDPLEKQRILDSFRKNQEEYMARKESQNSE